MSGDRDLRRKEKITYTISDDSEVDESPSGVSSFSTPQKTKRARQIIELDSEDDDDDTDELQEITRPDLPRLSSAGHSLRQPKELSLSLKAQENQVKRVSKKRRLSLLPPKKKTQRLKLVSKSANGTPNAHTARADLRNNISATTTARRTTFFVEKKDYFLPLLPINNKISSLAAEAERFKAIGGRITPTVPYEKIEVQPKG
jgi:SWI/SNF-related matrix-associated actin-dependent regulator of chromatin subfamily A member 5